MTTNETTNETTIEANPIRPPTDLERLYHLVSALLCMIMLILGHLTLLPPPAQLGLNLAATPAILVFCYTLDYLAREEQFHLLTHFVFYLVALTSFAYEFLPLKEWFEAIGDPPTATVVRVLAWPAGLTAMMFSELFFYALFSRAGNQDLGLYGSYRKQLGQLFASDLLIWSGKNLQRLGEWSGKSLQRLGEAHKIRNEGRIMPSASMEPLLNGADGLELENEASFPPPYLYDTSTHTGHLYRNLVQKNEEV